MPAPACSDDHFIELWHRLGANGLAANLGIAERAVLERRRRIERRHGIKLQALNPATPTQEQQAAVYKHYNQRVSIDLEDGIVLVASDSHYLGEERTPAHRALVKLASELKPRVVVMNGDVMEGATISRWPRIGWEKRPNVKEELNSVTARLGEITDAAPKARHVWPLGNHDARFELRLAGLVPEYEGVGGFTLKEHFPDWIPCWSLWINDEVVIKHRFKSGIHAVHNNTMWAGKTMLTGHLHSLKVSPLSDYNGTRWGVDTGTLAEPYGQQFEGYLEDNPRNWRSGFIVLTFHKGRLMWPEIVAKVDDDSVEFRGQMIQV